MWSLRDQISSVGKADKSVVPRCSKKKGLGGLGDRDSDFGPGEVVSSSSGEVDGPCNVHIKSCSSVSK